MMNAFGCPTRHVRQTVMKFPDAPTNDTRNVADRTDTIWMIGWKLSETFNGSPPNGRLPAHNRACWFADERVAAAFVWTAPRGGDVMLRSGGEAQYGASHGRCGLRDHLRTVRATSCDTKR
jgi:hypothetical protein